MHPNELWCICQVYWPSSIEKPSKVNEIKTNVCSIRMGDREKEKKSNWLHLLIKNNIPQDKPTMFIRGFDLVHILVQNRFEFLRRITTMNSNKRKGYKRIRHVVRCSVFLSIWQRITNIQRWTRESNLFATGRYFSSRDEQITRHLSINDCWWCLCLDTSYLHAFICQHLIRIYESIQIFDKLEREKSRWWTILEWHSIRYDNHFEYVMLIGSKYRLDILFFSHYH